MCAARSPGRRTSAPVSGVPGSTRDTGIDAQPRAASGPAPPLRGCRCRRKQRGMRRTCGSRARMNAASTIAQTFDAVRLAPGAAAFERADLGRSCADDQLAAAPVRDAVRRAELVEQPRAVDAVPRLQRASRIVDAGVNHLAVVRARAHAGARLALEHTDAVAAPGDGQRRGQADHACADHRGINLFPCGCRVRIVEDDRLVGRPWTGHAMTDGSDAVGPLSPRVAVMTSTRVLVTGAAGRLGAAIVSAFAGSRRHCAHEGTLDITDAAAVDAPLRRGRPDVIINCAAFNDVDGAEDRRRSRRSRSTRLRVRSLARAARGRRRRAGALQHRLRVRRHGHRSRTTRRRRRRRAAPTPRRSCLASGSRSTRRARYVLRVESLFGAADGWTGPTRHARRHRRRARGRARGDGCSPTASCRRATSPDIAAATRHLRRLGRGAGAVSLRELGSGDLARRGAEAARELLGVDAALVAGHDGPGAR